MNINLMINNSSDAAKRCIARIAKNRYGEYKGSNFLLLRYLKSLSYNSVAELSVINKIDNKYNMKNQNILKPASVQLQIDDPEYVKLVSHISELWENAKNKAVYAVNAELLDANWQTGQYIVEFEQEGNSKAKYGDRLLVNLSKDLTRLKGRGFSRSNLTYMRKLYLTFPKCETLSHKLTWSHYFELLKCDDLMELQFYMKECIKEGWKVRELKRQINSSLYQRIALSTDKEGVLALAKEGHQVMSPADIIRDPYILEFTGIPQQKRYKESELEEALKANMEKFLLELGRGFAFMGRQYVIPIGSRRFKVDLVFQPIGL